MPLYKIKNSVGIYGLYQGKTRKSVRASEITAYYINYRNEEGKTLKQRTEATTVKEAELLLKQRIIERDRNKDDNTTVQRSKLRGKITIAGIAEEYIQTISEEEGKRVQSAVKNRFGYVADLKRVREMDVKKLQKGLTAEGFAPKTINNITDRLRTIIRFGVKNDFLDNNSYKMESYSKLATDNISTVFFEPKEIRKLFKRSLLPDKVLLGEEKLENDYEPSYHKLRNQFFLKMLYYTGQRPASVLRLQKKDIKSDHVHIAPIKKQPSHKVPISAKIHDDLIEWVSDLKDDHYLFHSKNTPSIPINRATIIKQVRALFSALNAGKSYKDDRKEWASMYTLRHSAATNIMASTGSLALAGKLLNHQDSRTTKRYAKVVDELVKGAVDGL